jgi:quercetin dioxygenase-like cupin family protein
MHSSPGLALTLVIVAVAGVAALSAQAPPTTVTVISGTETRAAFEKGRPLIETSTYKVHASRREAPGQAEWHGLDTDLLYVLEGTATIVTGGELTEGKDTAANERRGAGIAGGASRALAKGDVIIIPAGTAHQFTAVSTPFLYYTVKVTAAPSAGRPK